MALVPPSQVRNVTGLTDPQKETICDFLQGAAYCWCKNRPKEDWFSLRSLMGGENYFWSGTPMLPLWEKHNGVSSDPVKAAGKDGGWLLKKVLADDVRTFETREGAFIREYRWVPEAGFPREQ
jgi:hypothetical protein